MLTRNQLQLPETTQDHIKNFDDLKKALVNFFFDLNRKGALAIVEQKTWTPTITANTGTFTTVSATGVYFKIESLYFFRVLITITTNGTAAGYVKFTLPATATAASVFYGRETGVTGKQLQGDVAASSNLATCEFYDNTYPGADGATLTMSGFFW